MVIQKMNNVLVKHSKVLFGIFTAIIIVSFVWFFTPGVDGSLLFGGGVSDKTKYGSFQDRPITYGDLNRSMRLLSIIAPRADFSEEDAFFFTAKRFSADAMGVTVSDEMLRKAIQENFQEDGRFSPEQYASFEAQNLTPRGLSKSDYESALREFLCVQLSEEYISANVTMTDSEFQELLNEQLEKFSFCYIQFRPELLAGDVKYTDDELKEFFEANKSAFLPPALCSGLTAVAWNKNFSAPTDQEVKSFYEAHKDDYKGKTPDAASAEIREKLASENGAEAKKAVQNFYKAMKEQARAEDFAEKYETVFRETAARYKLEIIERKKIPAVEGMETAEALTVLKNPGSMTNPAFLPDRAQVSILTSRQEFTDTTFEAARERVKAAYCLEKAKELVPAAVEKFQKAVKESKNPSADLEKIAKECKADVMKLPGNLPRMTLAQFTSQTPQIAALLFRTKAGGFSQSLSSPSGGALIIHVFSRQPASPEEYGRYAGNPQVRQMMLSMKKQCAVQEYNDWIVQNCKITVERRTNAVQPDSAQ